MDEYIFDVEKIKPLSDTDRFRGPAIHFEKNGYYQQFPEGSIQKKRYWDKEIEYCLKGITLNGDFLPGYMYFYLNYSPIQKIEEKESVDGSDFISSDRIEGFPDFWDGDYEYFMYLHEAERRGKHAVLLKCRGRGFSFKGSSMMNRNYFLIKSSVCYAIASDKEFLLKDGLLSKTWATMAFVDRNTPWRKRRTFHNDQMWKRASYEKDKIECGYMSDIIGVSTHNDPDKIRGKRGKLFYYEEAGVDVNLLVSYNATLPSVQLGKKTFGMIVVGGTGGSRGGHFAGLREMFNNPDGYNILPCRNVWSNSHYGKKSGFFFSVVKNLEGFMGADGVSDLVGAEEHESRQRKIKSVSSTDSNQLKRYIAENCMTPEEAMLRITGTMFPVAELEEHLEYVLSHPKDYIDKERIGKLVVDRETGNIKWKQDTSNALRPIYDFPIRDNKFMEGAVAIYEPPQTTSDGKIPYSVYISGCDTYDDDESTTTSLGSVFILNRLTDRIVAEYTGRPQTAKEFYEIARKLLKFYNAVCNYENNKKGMFSYFENKNCLYMLADTPKILKDQELAKISTLGNKSKGTHASEPVNRFGRELIKTWLLEPAVSAISGDVLNLHKIRSIPLLKELIEWAPDVNTDRVDALSMLMILREDMMKIVAESERNEPVIDEFFTRSPLFRENLNIPSPF